MFDLISFILIVIFTPLISLVCLSISKKKDYRLFCKIFSLIFLLCELIRFLYNASLFSNAATPSNQLKLSYISFMCVISLIATFNTTRIAVSSRRLFVLTTLFPIIIGLFNNNVYLNEFDNYGIIKGLYFFECGLCIMLALCFLKNYRRNFSLKPMFMAVLWTIAYIGISGLFGYLLKNNEVFTFKWSIMVLSLLLSIFVVFVLNYLRILFIKKHDKKSH